MDILKKYKRYKKISNLSVVAISLVVAFGVNFFVLNKTNISQNLKTSLLESEQKNNIGDIYFKNIGNDLVLKTSKNINNIENISFSINYNPENVEILDVIPKLNSEIIKNSSDDGITTIMINYAEKNNIKTGEKILTIKVNKKQIRSENLNIISSNFTDSDGNTYELSNSSITF